MKQLQKPQGNPIIEGYKPQEDKQIQAKNPETRVVRLVYNSCCGCGCYDETVERTVPFNSPMKNGDRITKLLDDDEII